MESKLIEDLIKQCDFSQRTIGEEMGKYLHFDIDFLFNKLVHGIFESAISDRQKNMRSHICQLLIQEKGSRIYAFQISNLFKYSLIVHLYMSCP